MMLTVYRSIRIDLIHMFVLEHECAGVRVATVPVPVRLRVILLPTSSFGNYERQ